MMPFALLQAQSSLPYPFQVKHIGAVWVARIHAVRAGLTQGWAQLRLLQAPIGEAQAALRACRQHFVVSDDDEAGGERA